MTPPCTAFTQRATGRLRDLVLPVQVGLAKKLADLFGIEVQKVQVNALWDTGASNSCISTRLANMLHLPNIGMTKIHSAGGIHDSRVFSVDFDLSEDLIHLQSIEVNEFLQNDRFDVIIGMDIITLGDFSITNANGKSVFSYRIPPDAFPVDYVEMVNKGQARKKAIAHFKKKQKRR